MSLFEGFIASVASIIDRVIPDKAERERAKLELLRLQGTQEMAPDRSAALGNPRRSQFP